MSDSYGPGGISGASDGGEDSDANEANDAWGAIKDFGGKLVDAAHGFVNPSPEEGESQPAHGDDEDDPDTSIFDMVTSAPWKIIEAASEFLEADPDDDSSQKAVRGTTTRSQPTRGDARPVHRATRDDDGDDLTTAEELNASTNSSGESDAGSQGGEDPEHDREPVGDDWTEKALDLRKQALDKSQAAEEARAGLEETSEYRRTIESKLENSQQTAETTERAMLDVSARRQGASEDELAQLEEEQAQLEIELAGANDAVRELMEDLDQFDEAFARLQAEAKSLSDEAQTLRVAATETVTASLPAVNITGSEDDFVVARDPGTLSGPVSPDRLRHWLAERNESAYQREQLAGRSLGQAEVDEDLADSYTQMSREAAARAATERAGIETDRAQIERLTVRKTEAEAIEKRLADEVEQESAQLERLREAGDTAGAEAASERVTGLLQRQFQWSSQANSLEDRIEARQASTQRSEEEATDYDQLASEFTDLAERHEGFADFGERMGAELHDEIDSDDFLTDKVEDALASSDATDLDLDFHFIDGRDNTELHIEVDRETQPVQTAPTPSDDVESASEEIDPINFVAPGSDTPPPEGVVVPGMSAIDVDTDDVNTDALHAETLDPAEFDTRPEADVGAEPFEPTEIAGIQLDPADDEFAQQIDVAEQLEDSLEDFLDDQA